MTLPLVPTHGFYTTTASGDRCCRVCLGLRGGHDPECAVIAVERQVQELSGQLALTVAQMRETFDSIEQLIHGEEARG